MKRYPRSARTRDADPAGAGVADPAVIASRPLLENLRFPGCRPLPLPRGRFEEDFDFDEQLEYWDARTETAWVAETPGIVHEDTSRRLLHLVYGIATARGAPIRAIGTIGLVERDAGGDPVRAMQPDETLYLHPGRTVFPAAGPLVIGRHDLPDVVLEVDHTTDIRPGKLPVYEAWGVPELWAVVPEGARRRRPGVTIHRMIGGRYRSSPASVALPGWTAAEIHAALTERVTSARTDRVLERVGRVLGEREGTKPDDVPLIRSFTEEARAEGYAEGRAEARVEELAAAAHAVLQARGIRLTGPPLAGSLVGASREKVMAVMAAAGACTDEADFRRRLDLPRR